MRLRSTGLARGVVAGLRSGARLSLPEGEIRFLPTSLMRSLEIPDNAEIRRLSAEQSNSSLVIGDKLVMKIVRRVAPGVHPEGEMTRYLTEHGYANTAPLFGELVRVDTDGTPNTFGLVQGFVRNQGDAWAWTLDFLARTSRGDRRHRRRARGRGRRVPTYNAFAARSGVGSASCTKLLSATDR